MKIFVLLFVLLVSVNVSAEITDVTIDNLMRVGGANTFNPMLFEVCGRVIADEPVALTIISDPNTSRLAPYTTRVDENGAYCKLVASFNGRVLVKARSVHGKDHGGVVQTSKSYK